MREEFVDRDYFWVVEAVDRKGMVSYFKEFDNFEAAFEKYTSLKGKFSVTLERRFTEYLKAV